jgi:flagellar biosynthesis protein FlhG
LSNLLEVDALRELGRATRRAPIVLFTGGKGGIGKTTLAIESAAALARRGRRVLLVDLDLGLANVHVILRTTPGRSIEDALRGRCTLAECVVRGAHGFDLLAASSGERDLAQLPEALRAQLFDGVRQLAADYDLVIADSAAGIGPDVLAFAAGADHVLVLTTPEAAALTDAYGVFKALHQLGEATEREVPTPELVVNRARGLEQAESVAAKLRAVCERFLARSPKSAGWFPFCRSLAEDAHPRRSRPDELSAGCIARLAARLERLVQGLEKTSNSSNPWA